MLKDNDAIATIAVKDLNVAKAFYADKLGLAEESGSANSEAITYLSGRSKLMVYRSSYAGTNQATAATWVVDDLDAVVRALKGKGVVFEHYDLPQLTLEGDVHAGNGLRVVWFKDPDGNTLTILSTKAG